MQTTFWRPIGECKVPHIWKVGLELENENDVDRDVIDKIIKRRRNEGEEMIQRMLDIKRKTGNFGRERCLFIQILE